MQTGSLIRNLTCVSSGSKLLPSSMFKTSSAINRSVLYNQQGRKNILNKSALFSTFAKNNSAENPQKTETTEDSYSDKYVSLMTWDEYFQLKKNRRIRDRVLSYPAAFISSGATGSYLMTNIVLDPANNGLIMGLDPFIVFGLGAASAGLVAFLVAPLIGSLGYRILKPKTYNEMIKVRSIIFWVS